MPPPRDGPLSRFFPMLLQKNPVSIFGLFLVALTSVAAADVSVTPAEPATELPALVVDAQRELPPRESWRYGQTADWEVLSNGSDRVAKRLVRELAEFQALVGVMFPAIAGTSADVPLVLVLCGNDKSFNQFQPDSDWDVRDHTQSFMGEADGRLVMGVHVVVGEREIDDTETMPAEVEDGAAVASAGVIAADPYAAVKRQYFRFLFTRAVGSPPEWLESGVARLLGSVERTQKGFMIGKIGSFTGGAADDFQGLFAVARRAMPPLETLLTASRPEKQEEQAAWEMLAYAFVHKCLMEGRGKNQEKFLNFAQQASRKPVSEAMFQECFGRSFAQMEKDLWVYVNAGSFKHMRLTLPKDMSVPKPPEIALRDGTDSEVGRIKSSGFRAMNQPALAYNELLAPYIRGERDPRLLGALGVVQVERDQHEKARKLLEAAYAQKTTEAAALVTLARLRLEEARAKPGAVPDRLSKRQVIDVLTPLFAAREQLPRRSELYQLIAETWRYSGQAPTAANLEVVAEGVNVFPRDVALVLAATEVYAKHGFTREATVLAEGGLKIAKTGEAARRFSEIIETLKSSPGPTPPAP